MVESDYIEKFKRRIIKDAISQSNQMDSTEYYIGKKWNPSDPKEDLINCYNIELNLRDNRPSLSFTYLAKCTYKKEWIIKLKKGDKLYFSNGLTPYLELEVIHPSHASKDENDRTVDFFLLEKDIESLINNQFKEIVIVYKDGRPRTSIKNIWYGFDIFGFDIFRFRNEPVPNDACEEVFCAYVSAYKNALLSAGLISSPKREKTKESKAKFDPCYVYLMHDLKNGYHKIGISKTPKYREKTLQSEKPTIELVCSKEYPSRKIAEAIEAALHKVYEENRIRGEWFELSDSDVAILKETLK